MVLLRAEIPSMSEGMPAAGPALQPGLAYLSFLDRLPVLTAELCAVRLHDGLLWSEIFPGSSDPDDVDPPSPFSCAVWGQAIASDHPAAAEPNGFG